MKPLDTREVQYAYRQSISIIGNEQLTDAAMTDGIYTQVTNYKTRISISYELKDSNRQLLDTRQKDYFSDPSPTKWNDAQICAFVNENLANFIAAGKEEFSGYQSV